MAKYDVYISYDRQDGTEIAKILHQALESRGIAVWFDSSSTAYGSSWVNQTTEAISSSRYFIPVITESYSFSDYAKNELMFAWHFAAKRQKIIIPVVSEGVDTKTDIFQFYLARIQQYKIENAKALPALADKISNRIRNQIDSEDLYEKISEYSKLGNSDKEADAICQLSDRLCDRFQTETDSLQRKKICMEMLRLYRRLEEYTGRYDAESRATSRRMLRTLDNTSQQLSRSETEILNDLFLCAFAIQMIHLDREIRTECADVISSGDAADPCPVGSYVEKQKPYVEAFQRLQSAQLSDNKAYTDEESAIISDASRFIFTSGQTDTAAHPAKSREHSAALSQEDEILLSIAHFMQEGNKLFDILQKERMEGNFLRCLLTSYERLKAYCQIVGAADVAAQCVDRILEIRNMIEKSGDADSVEGKVEKGLKSLLGFTLHGSGSYDVFISFKNEDSDLAESIYTYCKKHFKEPFWSKRSLPELSTSEYEDAIFDALRKSRHFIVVLSKIEYLQEKWVKKEMATFDRAITEGRKTDSNFLFVVTDDVYDEIIRSKKMCLDERYCGYQIIKMSEYESVLYQYLKE